MKNVKENPINITYNKILDNMIGADFDKKYNIPVLNETQWNKVIDNVKETTKLHIVDSFDKNSLKNDYFLYTIMQNIYEQIHSASIKIQEN